MKVISLTIIKKDMENTLIQMAIIILDNGIKIHSMAKVYYIMKTEILYMMENLLKENLKVMENIIMMTVIVILDNGKMV